VRSAHDCSEGGLAVALAESCFNPDGLLGAEVNLSGNGWRSDVLLFNELQSRIVISVAKENAKGVCERLEASGVAYSVLGSVDGDELRISAQDQTFHWPIAELYDSWFNFIARAVESDSLAEGIPSL
jgi:phosphoribosylformylglycinamidine synthase